MIPCAHYPRPDSQSKAADQYDSNRLLRHYNNFTNATISPP